MPLVSRLFSGDPRLEACAVQDSAHLTPGTQGPFVAKAQKALIMLGEEPVATREYNAGQYGPSTAAAVLSFKRKRDIVNRSYQTSADDIIGKMTIRRLDEEMAKLESYGPLRCQCGDPVLRASNGAANRARQFEAFEAKVGAPAVAAPLPSVLWIGWQITTLGESLGGRRHAAQIEACNKLMNDVMIVPTGGDLPHVRAFEYAAEIEANNSDAISLRRAAGRARAYFPRAALRVIVHGFTGRSPEFGFTTGGTFGGETFGNFVVLNAAKMRRDNLTLLHEMIHATNLQLVHDSDPKDERRFIDDTSVFSSNDNRDHIRKPHLDRLKAMPWCTPYPE